jgi:tRNA (mo5U34)-methyltransferase
MKETGNSFEQKWNDERSLRSARERAIIEGGGWWHSIDLGDGSVTHGISSPDYLRKKYESFGLPEDLTGKRVLDVGCWDGYYSFEAERHGATVVSVDCFRPENYFKAHAALNSKAQFHEMSVYDLDRKALGTFDIVLFLGVLYHLRHPLLGLERICGMTRDMALIESHVTDAFFESARPVMEFYELDELGAQYDNWWGPNRECLIRMIRSAGFARVELLPDWDQARITARTHRKWERNPALESSPSITLSEIFNPITWSSDVPLTGRHAFLGMYVKGLGPDITRESVRVHIGEFGIVPHYVGDSQYAGYQQINAPTPPGLDNGTASVWVEAGIQRSNESAVHLVEGSAW